MKSNGGMEKDYGKLGAKLVRSLEEAVEWARGERELQVDCVPGPVGAGNPVEKPPAYLGFQIADIRAKLGLSRELFARLLGASVSSVAAWETGRREPSGAARRLLQVADRYPDQVLDVLLMSAEEIGETIPGQRAAPTRIERPVPRKEAADTQG
jgi:DNA-binding XRE family transcriptional regulator